MAVTLFFSGSAVAQTCANEAEPNDDLETATRHYAEFCVEAMGGAGDQDLILWQLSELDARSRWRLAVAPGEQTAARLTIFALTFDENGEAITGQDKIYDVSNITGGDGNAAPALILRPGTYAIGVAATEGEDGYRLDVTAADPLPAAMDPGSTPAFVGEFDVTGTFGSDEVVVPWTIDPEAARNVWNLALQLPLTTRATLSVEDATGARLATANRLDDAGVIWLPDLGLEAADYQISISGVREPATALLSAAAAGPFDVSHESEPNDSSDLADSLELDAVQNGRMFGSESSDTDYFTFQVDEDREGQVFDIVALTSVGVDVQLILEDSDRIDLMARRGESGEIRLDKLGLAQGQYFVKLVGPSAASNAFELSIEERGPRVAGQEWEPNETPSRAVDLGPNDSSQGNFDGRETDIFTLDVTGEMQLWRIQAVGDELIELNLLDSSGNSVARALNETGERIVRMSNLLLAPGTHHISIRGDGGNYLIRALAIGSPPGMSDVPMQAPEASNAPIDNADELAIETAVITNEIEPNGSIARAMPLTFGETRTGQIISPDDTEYYRFYLSAGERVKITMTAPPGVELRADLGWGASESHIARLENTPLPDARSTLEWDGLLPAGDYYLHIRGYAHGMQPYSLLLERQHFFDRPTDLEPNDEWWLAAPMPASLRLTGDLFDRDEDWYRVPPLVDETTFSVVPAADAQQDGGGISLEILAEEATEYGDLWPAPSAGRVRTISGNATTGWEGTLPAGVPLFIGVTGGPRRYDLQLLLDGTPVVGPQTPPPVNVRLDLDQPEVAAFLVERQTATGTLAIENQSNDALALEIATHVGDARWHLNLPAGPISVSANATENVPFSIDIAPDAWTDLPVAIEIAVHKPGATESVLASATIVPTVEASPVTPTPGWPVPDTMLGGLNVAWTAHGAAALDTDDTLNDGLVQGKGAVAWRNRVLTTLDPTVDLAGDDPVPLVGVLMSPAITTTPLGMLQNFRILTSLDGETFDPVLNAALTPRPEPQAFAFSEPVDARYVRLDPIDSHGGNGHADGATLGDLAVVAAPDHVLEPQGFDIGMEQFGGHPVWTWPQFDARGFCRPSGFTA